MDVFVSLVIPQIGEFLVAVATLVRFLLPVYGAFVIPGVAALRETRRADSALIRFLQCVRATVDGQFAALPKAPVAKFTTVGQDSGVSTDVNFEVAPGVEPTITVRTFKRFFTGMGPGVNLEGAAGPEFFAAFVAVGADPGERVLEVGALVDQPVATLTETLGAVEAAIRRGGLEIVLGRIKCTATVTTNFS